jgi:hypothetical protein
MADEIVVNGATIKMTFGRLNFVASQVDDIGEVDLILVSPQIQEKMLRAFLAKYKTEDGVSRYDIDDLITDIDSLEISDAMRILDFIEGQLHDFFIKALNRVDEKAKAREEKMKSSDNTSNGQKS